MNACTVIIATYGDERHWNRVAAKAVESALSQSVGVDLIRIHGDTLAEARNSAAVSASTEWLCFLDADDSLDSVYVEKMLSASGDIRRPATLGVYEDGTQDDFPVLIPRTNLSESNFIVIGAFVRREQFLRVGCFRELPALEDWDLWIRCWRDGASIEDVPEAIYRVTVRQDSRNQQSELHNRAYRDIRRRYFR